MSMSKLHAPVLLTIPNTQNITYKYMQFDNNSTGKIESISTMNSCILSNLINNKFFMQMFDTYRIQEPNTLAMDTSNPWQQYTVLHVTKVIVDTSSDINL